MTCCPAYVDSCVVAAPDAVHVLTPRRDIYGRQYDVFGRRDVHVLTRRCDMYVLTRRCDMCALTRCDVYVLTRRCDVYVLTRRRDVYVLTRRRDGRVLTRRCDMYVLLTRRCDVYVLTCTMCCACRLQDYRGPSSASEPETQAMMAFLRQPERFTHAPTGTPYNVTFSIAFNFHTYGRYVNLPYSCRRVPQSPLDAMIRHVIIRATKWNRWEYGHSFERVRACTAVKGVGWSWACWTWGMWGCGWHSRGVADHGNDDDDDDDGDVLSMQPFNCTCRVACRVVCTR